MILPPPRFPVLGRRWMSFPGLPAAGTLLPAALTQASALSPEFSLCALAAQAPFHSSLWAALVQSFRERWLFSAVLHRRTYPLAAVAFAKCRVRAREGWFHSALNMKCHLLRSRFLAVLCRCDAAARLRAPSKWEISGELAESPCPRLLSLRMGLAACLGGEVVLAESWGRDVAMTPL